MSTIVFELRSAIRALLRAPRFSLTALLILASSIAAATLTFSLVNTVLLRELPYPSSDRLFYLRWKTRGTTLDALSAGKISFWRRYSRTIEEFAVTDLASTGVNIAGDGRATYVGALHVSKGFFRTLGVHPLLGRGFLSQEERAGGERAVVLTDGLWKREFHGDRTLLSRSITVNGQSYTVVGVMPPGFTFTPGVDVLLPLQVFDSSEMRENVYAVIARTRAGVSPGQAQAEMTSTFQEFRSAYPDQVETGEQGVRLEGYREWIVGDVKTGLMVMFGAVSLVLLIACIDIGVLLLVRMAHRREEFALRAALGASKAQLARQVITESLVLAAAGGALGFLAVRWSLPAILSLIPDELPRMAEISLDFRSAAFSMTAAAASAIIFGVLPALRAEATNLSEWLKQSAQRTTASLKQMRLGYVLVAGQVATSLMLLIGAALLFETLLHLQSRQLGFNPESRLAFEVALAGKNYESTKQTAVITKRVLEALGTLPGVISAASVSSLPTQSGMNIPLHVDGKPDDDESVEYRAISPEYFLTMGIPVISGRAFTASDSAGAPAVVIVNATAARLFRVGSSPDVYLAPEKSMAKTFADHLRQIVGVVGDIREAGPDQDVPPTVFVPLAQVPDGLTLMMNNAFRRAFIVRTARIAGVVAQVRYVVPAELPVASARSMTEVVHATIARVQFQALLMLVFGGFALLLTGVGIYGVFSFEASQRSHELAIRASLGALPFQLLLSMLRQPMLTAIAGVLAGMAGAVGFARFLASMLFGLRPTDPATLASAAVGITAVTLLATYLPARRAIKENPIEALKAK